MAFEANNRNLDIEIVIKQHNDGETYYITKKGNFNPLIHKTHKTYRLSLRGAEAVRDRILAELEAKKKGIDPNV